MNTLPLSRQELKLLQSIAARQPVQYASDPLADRLIADGYLSRQPVRPAGVFDAPQPAALYLTYTGERYLDWHRRALRRWWLDAAAWLFTTGIALAALIRGM